MRILIVSIARSGSTILTKWMAKELDYVMYLEPNQFRNTDGDNVVIKYVWDVMKFQGIKINTNDWDKIIRLSRRDTRSAGESFTRARDRNEWSDEYTITPEWISRNENTIQHWQRELETNRGEMLSQNWKGINVEYENIYENKTDTERICQYIGITHPKYLDMLDNVNRYRKPTRLV